MDFETSRGFSTGAEAATSQGERVDRTTAYIFSTPLHDRQLAQFRRSCPSSSAPNLPPPNSTSPTHHHNPELENQQQARVDDRGFEEAKVTYTGFEAHDRAHLLVGPVNVHINGGVNHFFGYQGRPNRRVNIVRLIIDMICDLVGL